MCSRPDNHNIRLVDLAFRNRYIARHNGLNGVEGQAKGISPKERAISRLASFFSTAKSINKQHVETHVGSR